jgi:hypothetical protein
MQQHPRKPVGKVAERGDETEGLNINQLIFIFLASGPLRARKSGETISAPDVNTESEGG